MHRAVAQLLDDELAEVGFIDLVAFFFQVLAETDLTPTTLAILVCAALLHSGAHVALKSGKDKLAFAWWQLAAILVFYSPVLLTAKWDWPLWMWLIVVASGLVEAAYFYTTSRAYTLGDLSVTYPLARGSAPLFIVLWAILFLREQPSTLGYAGILTIAAGLFLVNLSSLADVARPLKALAQPAARWALAAGLCIGTYSVMDKVGGNAEMDEAIIELDDRDARLPIPPLNAPVKSIAWNPFSEASRP